MVGSAFLCYSRLQLIECGPPTLGRTICFNKPIYPHVNLIQKHSHGHTQNKVWLNIWLPYDPVKLAYNLNHYKYCVRGRPSRIIKKVLEARRSGSVWLWEGCWCTRATWHAPTPPPSWCPRGGSAPPEGWRMGSPRDGQGCGLSVFLKMSCGHEATEAAGKDTLQTKRCTQKGKREQRENWPKCLSKKLKKIYL